MLDRLVDMADVARLLETQFMAPLSGLLEKLLLDFDVVDLALWFPNLTWSEFATSLAAVVACKAVTDEIEEMIVARLRSWLADQLIRLAAVIRPRPEALAAAPRIAG